MSKIRLKRDGQMIEVESMSTTHLSPKTGFTFETIASGSDIIAGQYKVTCEADVSSSLEWTGFTFERGYPRKQFYVWFNIDKQNKNPNFADKQGIEVNITENETADSIASKMIVAINKQGIGITAVSGLTPDIVLINNISVGKCNDITDGSGFDFSTVTGVPIYTITGYFYQRQVGDVTGETLIKVPVIRRVNVYEILEICY